MVHYMVVMDTVLILLMVQVAHLIQVKRGTMDIQLQALVLVAAVGVITQAAVLVPQALF
jgi:hypothetical protein